MISSYKFHGFGDTMNSTCGSYAFHDKVPCLLCGEPQVFGTIGNHLVDRHRIERNSACSCGEWMDSYQGVGDHWRWLLENPEQLRAHVVALALEAL